MSLIGIYRIVNNVNGKCYVGSAVNLNNRWRTHKGPLRKNKHGNSYFQNAWNKYGEENFIFEILEYVYDKKDLIKIEQYYIDWLDSANREFGYNICKVAGSTLGKKHTEKTKKILSEMASKRKASEETKEKIRKSLIGRVPWNHGKKASEETKRKMSESRKNEGNANSKLTWEKVREIREKYKIRVCSYSKIAKEYGVGISCVSDVINCIKWNEKRSN